MSKNQNRHNVNPETKRSNTARELESKRKPSGNTKSAGARRAEEYDSRRQKNSKYYDLSRSKSNDPSYYNRIPSMYDPATRFGFTHIEGDRFNWLPNGSNDATDSSVSFPWGTAVADGTQGTFNIRRIDFQATIGYVDDVMSPVNKAITMLMGELYSRLGASTLQFNGATLGYFLVGTSSMSCLIATLRRVLKTVKAFAPMNITYPRALVKAMGFDYDEIIENVDGYCEELNQVIRDFNNLKVPSFITMFPRQFALCDNVYVDEDNAKADITFFRPNNYYTYTLNGDTEMWYLASDDIPWNNPKPFRHILSLVEDVMEGWLHSQDLQYVRGTLLRAFKDDEYFIIPEVGMSDTLAPVVDKYIPMQIDNMWISPNYALYSTDIQCDITENPVGDYLMCTPYFDAQDFSTTAYDYWVIRKDNYDALSPDDFMEMTRLINLPVTDANNRVVFKHCSPEIVTGVALFMYNRYTDTLKAVSLGSNYWYQGDNFSDEWLVAAAAMQSFRHRPLLVFIGSDGTAYPMGDLVEYARLPYAKWRELQIAATYSMYSPTISGQIRQI